MSLLDLDLEPPKPAGPTFSPAEMQMYVPLLREADPSNSGVVEAQLGAAVLKKSNLNTQVLQTIWQQVDTAKSGRLNREQFCQALKLCATAISQNGGDPRTFLAPGGGSSTPGAQLSGGPRTPMSPGGGWAVSPMEKMQYDQIFNSLAPVGGFITGAAAKGHLMKSGLPTEKLAAVWQLADVDRDGRLDSDEFAVAMCLIGKIRQGQQVPPTLPADLIPPAKKRMSGAGGSGSWGPQSTSPMADLAGVQLGPSMRVDPSVPLEVISRDVMEFERRKNEAEAMVAQKEPIVDALQREVAALEAEQQTVQGRWQEATQKRNELGSQAALFDSKQAEYRRAIDQIKQRYDLESKAVSELQGQIAAQSSTVMEVEQQARRVHSEVGQVRDRQKQLAEHVESSYRELEALQRDIRAVQTQVLDMQRQLREEGGGAFNGVDPFASAKSDPFASSSRGSSRPQSKSAFDDPFGAPFAAKPASAQNDPFADPFQTRPLSGAQKPVQPPKPISQMSEEEQIAWALQVSQQEA